jgi:hypothetical protein
MVSSQMMHRLRDEFDTIESQSIDPQNYAGDDSDVVFDIITAETFVAGIASKILDSKTISSEEKQILNKEFVKGGNWLRADGSEYSLWHLPDVKEYVRSIEALRVICLQLVENK